MRIVRTDVILRSRAERGVSKDGTNNHFPSFGSSLVIVCFPFTTSAM
jgi:hypothetical protein